MDQIFLNKKVLVVDDEEKNIQLIGSILKKHEKKVKIFVASDGKEAIERCYSFMPDIILMDINMPKMDGIEACKKIKENDLFKDIPVIFLTAEASIEGKLKALRSLGNDYINKPVHEEELILRLKIHLSLKINQENLRNQLIQINNMIDNMEQSFFWVSEGGLIMGPTSKKSERVFGGEIENKNIFETIFKSIEKEKKDKIIDLYESFKEVKKENWDLFVSKIPSKVDYFNDKEQKNKNLNINCHPVWNEEGFLEKVIHSIDDRTEFEFLADKKNIYSIKAASQFTGVQENTIRSWERRHNALKPFRNEKGKRIYTESDIERINLLRRGVEKGINIGSLASLENEELEKLNESGENSDKPKDLEKKNIKIDEEDVLVKVKMALASKNDQILIHELHKLNLGGLNPGLSLDFFSILFEYMKELMTTNALKEKELKNIGNYFRKFFGPIIYSQISKKMDDVFILCTGKNNFWELESIQYELLLAEKELNFFNIGEVKEGKVIEQASKNFNSRNIIYVCKPQIEEERGDDRVVINEIIGKLNPKQKLILVGTIDFTGIDINKNDQVEVSLNIQGLDRQLINIIKYLSSF